MILTHVHIRLLGRCGGVRKNHSPSPNRLELSFLSVLALPKASSRVLLRSRVASIVFAVAPTSSSRHRTYVRYRNNPETYGKTLDSLI